MIQVKQIAVGGFDSNFAYLLVDNDTKQALLVDPSGDFEAIATVVAEEDVVIAAIVLTHTHADHYDRLSEAVEAFPAPVCVHEAGVVVVASVAQVKALAEGDELPLGETSVHVLHTPGHAEDALCLYVEAMHAESGHPELIAGDTLFVGGCGRTTEAGVDALYASLERLKALPLETVVYPGHDYGATPTSTIGAESANNPYLTVADKAEFTKRRLG